MREVIKPYPRGSIYTTIMELGPQHHNRDGLLVPNSIMVAYMDPLGIFYAALNLQANTLKYNEPTAHSSQDKRRIAARALPRQGSKSLSELLLEGC